ncbi:MAG: Uma2 family endonuclease [Planctomycetaceae bacterium]|nr:Uma2 family endonuclease [Planctomycetaceae bacterium]
MATTPTISELQRTAPLFTLTLQQYHALTESGILPDGEPVEFIEGLLVRKDRSDRGGNLLNHGVRPATGVKRGARVIERATHDLSVHVQVQLPVTLSNLSEPEPDYCLVKGLPEDFAHAHPSPRDLLLVVEVADNSLSYDRTTKCRVYASAGVSCYWIVNLVSDCVEVFTDPDTAEGSYRTHRTFPRGAMLEIPLGDGASRQISVDDIV